MKREIALLRFTSLAMTLCGLGLVFEIASFLAMTFCG